MLYRYTIFNYDVSSIFPLFLFILYQGSSQIIPSFFDPMKKVQLYEKHVIEKINDIINRANKIFLRPKEQAKQLVEEMKKKSEKVNTEAKNFVNNVLKNVSMRCINTINRLLNIS